MGSEGPNKVNRSTQTLSLKAGLHRFPQGIFGSTSELINPENVRERDTLMIACSEQGAAPDNVSFAHPGRFVVLQHIGASMPSKTECEIYEALCVDDVEKPFDRHDFRHVIVCGHLECGVIRSWLQPAPEGYSDNGAFRLRFERGARELVEKHYAPKSMEELCTLLICEHVLCQIENLLTHPLIMDRIMAQKMSFHAWVVDDETARVFGYSSEESAFVPI